MAERYFTHRVFEGDEDVLFVGLAEWASAARRQDALLGLHLCNKAEVNARFDEIEAGPEARTSSCAQRCQEAEGG